MHDIGEKIGKKLAEAEHQGAEGNVEESLKMMEEVERLKEEKRKAEVQFIHFLDYISLYRELIDSSTDFISNCQI